MGKKQKKPRRLGTGTTVFFLAVLFWLVASHPWLLLLPVAYWFCFSRPGRPEAVRRRPPPRAVAPAPAPKATPSVKAAAPDFIPKDRHYNRYLARTWDEEFDSLVSKCERVPRS